MYMLPWLCLSLLSFSTGAGPTIGQEESSLSIYLQSLLQTIENNSMDQNSNLDQKLSNHYYCCLFVFLCLSKTKHFLYEHIQNTAETFLLENPPSLVSFFSSHKHCSCFRCCWSRCWNQSCRLHSEHYQLRNSKLTSNICFWVKIQNKHIIFEGVRSLKITIFFFIADLGEDLMQPMMTMGLLCKFLHHNV